MSIILIVLVGIVFLVGIFTIGAPVVKAIAEFFLSFGKVTLVVALLGGVCYFAYSLLN